jgi:Na+-driven multidrug efflux pump
LTVVVATGFGTTELAATHVWFAIYSLLALALDALAIAGQALIGHGLGASAVERVHAINRRLLGWGVLVGVVLALVVVAGIPLIALVMTSDESVRAALPLTLIILAIGLPLAGVVFVLDGVLIGAGDGRYLAVTGVLNLAAYVAVVPFVGDLGWLLAAFTFVYLGARALTLGLRARGSAWIVTGANR